MYQDSIDTKVLYDIIASLVSCPGDIHIDRKEDEMGVLLSVKVNTIDMGILIGRNGVMATSIKVVMKAIGKSNNMQLRVQFLEPEGSTHVPGEKHSRPETSADAQAVDAPEVSKPATNIDHELDEFIMN